MPTKAKVALGVALFIGFSMTVPPSKPRVESVSVRSTQSQAEKGAVKNNITKQEAEAAKQKAEAEEKKLQEEQKAKAEEDKQNFLASEYCSKRKQTSRYYPIPEVTTGADGKKEYKQNDKLKKSGLNLTQTDCRNTVDYLNDLSLKYPLVTIDIQKVIERKYWIGMNVAELSYSLGYPNKINATNYGSGESQQWVYYQGSYGANPIYIYVENSVVTSYQTF